MLRYRWRRFLAFDVIAALAWALYASLLGYFGGQAFEHAAWKGLLLALGVGLAIGGIVEGVRWLLHQRRDQSRPAPARKRG
jgi:membrane protein DedA with SNARE-associated domain